MSAEEKPPLGRCEARVIPLGERRMRQCGRAATKKVGDRALCAKHALVARRREEFQKERSQQ